MVPTAANLRERLSAAIESSATPPGDEPHHWFLLVDAAQLPEDAFPWGDWARCGVAINLLGDDAHAQHPEVCPLLLRLESDQADALMQQQLSQRPFAFIAVLSHLERSVLARALSARCRIVLPQQRRGLLRFYDAAVLHALASVLTPHQQRYLLAPAAHWLYAAPEGAIATLRANGTAQALPPITSEQIDLLGQAAMPHRVLASLGKQGHIGNDADPFASLGRIEEIRAMLVSGGINDQPAIYEAVALLGERPVDATAGGQLQTMVRESAGNWERLRTDLVTWLDAEENTTSEEALTS